jgi:hypothetical protein
LVPVTKLSIDAKSGIREWNIPQDDRPPYTNRRAKNMIGINISILKAIASGYQVLPELYGLSDEVFNIILDNLIQNKMTSKIKIEDVIYYNATLEGE